MPQQNIFLNMKLWMSLIPLIAVLGCDKKAEEDEEQSGGGEEQSGEGGAATELCAEFALVTEDVCDDDLGDSEENGCLDSYLRASEADCLDDFTSLVDCTIANPSGFYCYDGSAAFDYAAACMPEAEAFIPCAQ